MDAETQFMFHITDGYSFRNCIRLIKSEIDHATMVLSPKSIEISFINISKCAIHKIVLKTAELAMYRYNIRDSNGELYPEFPIAFETNEIFNTTKSIGRKDGIRLYWLKDDKKINIQPIKTSTKDPGRASALFVNIINTEYSRCDVPNVYGAEPNVRVQAKDFADLCSQANTLKCGALEIIGSHNAVTFQCILPNNKPASINRFVSQTEVPKQQIDLPSNISEIDSLISTIKSIENQAQAVKLTLNIIKTEDLMTVKVPIGTVKALSNIHNISPAGTQLKFFFCENKPVKIESKIGTYGDYIICLRNSRV